MGKKNAPEAAAKTFLYRDFFVRAPKKKFQAPKKEFRGSEFRVPAPKFRVRAPQKVNDTDKNLHKSPVLCKKIARKSAVWAGLRKSRVTKIIQNGTICLFSQTFHDILSFLIGGAAFLLHIPAAAKEAKSSKETSCRVGFVI